QRRIFPDVATCGVLPSGEGICGQKKRNVPPRRSGYHFCVSPQVPSERAVSTPSRTEPGA
ncbi:hypothetical protein, partial [Brevibacillus brevis]|uniref:hypothetical protein n=1 Tax=Brevibacillus brevis TaxID=1393 RepID=UPI001C631B7F